MAIAAVGILSYSGVTFDSLHRTKLSGVPEYDESGRVVKWIKWTLEVEGWIGGSIDTAAEMEDKRIKLTTPAQTLIHTGKGFGALFVNRVGPPLDVNWGPKPEMLSWRPLGGKQGCAISWRISFCIPECAKSRFTGIVTVAYDIDLDVDVDGYTTRGIAGSVVIAQTRQPFSNRVLTTADSVYEQVFPANMRGFQRTVRSRKISKDRNTLTFHFVDKELPVPLPEKTTTIQIEETLSSRLAKPYCFTRWDLRFSGSANTPAGQSKTDTLNAALAVVQSKLRKFKKLKNLPGFEGLSVDADNNVAIMPVSCSFSDALLDRGVRFDLAYQLLNCIGIRKAIAASQMYLPPDGLDYDKWAKSIQDGPAHPRGVARMTVPGNDEVLIDLCLGPTVTTLKPGRLPNSTTLRPGKIPAPRAASAGNVPPESSWLDYVNTLDTVTKNRVARHKRLPTEDPDRYTTLRTVDSTSQFMQVAKQDSDTLPEPKAKTDDVIQSLGSPSYNVVMSGYALRLDHQIQTPALISINGVKATQVGGKGGCRLWSAIGDVPIYLAAWSFEYMLPRKYEGDAPNLANPFLGIDGGKAI